MNIRIHSIKDAKSQFCVRFSADGEPYNLCLRKGNGLREEDEDGNPKFMKHLVDHVERKNQEEKDLSKYEQQSYEV